MSGRGKRIWAPRLDFNGAYEETLTFFKRAKEHNILQKQPASLYQVYQPDGSWPVDGMDEISRYLRFGYDHTPQIDRGRQAAARLLAVATKAHFFLDDTAIVPHEPHLFVMPDLSMAGQLRYGLLYPMETQGRLSTMLVADWDVGLAASTQPKLAPAQRFPTVLTEQPYHWLTISRWRALRKEAEQSPWGGSFTHPFARRKVIQLAREHTDVATFPYGTPLDYPMDLNGDVQALGGLWAPGIRRWYLPTGYDVEAARSFLDAQLARTPQERHALRWWAIQRAPKAANNDAPAEGDD